MQQTRLLLTVALIVLVAADSIITLQLNPETNYVIVNENGCVVKTTFSHIQLNLDNMTINTSDFSGANTTVISGSCCNTPPATFGTVGNCGWATATAMVDLTGTGYKVVSEWQLGGWLQSGNAVKSNDNQTVALWASGNCGYITTAETIAAMEVASSYYAPLENGGWFLKVAPYSNIVTLVLNPATNFAIMSKGSCVVKTAFSHIQFNTQNMTINTGDFSGATTTVLSGSCSIPSNATFGTTGNCAWASATAKIDLTGTGYKVVSDWKLDGWLQSGNAVKSNNNQTVDLSATGDCGYITTLETIAAMEAASSYYEPLEKGGWLLRVAAV